MSIELSPHQETFLKAEAARMGVSEEEVARRAVDLYQSQMGELRDAIKTAQDQVDRGDVSSWDAQDFKARMREKHAHRIANAGD